MNTTFLDTGVSLNELTSEEIDGVSGGVFSGTVASGGTCTCVVTDQGMRCEYRVDG